MARPDQIVELAGKVLLEPEFRERFLDDPEGAAESIEVTLTAEQANFLKTLDRKAVEDLATDFAKPPENHIKGRW